MRSTLVSSPSSCRAREPQELSCQLVEHTWYLSERARRDVGLAVAVEDYVKKFKG